MVDVQINSDDKPWWQSKTIWAAIAAAVIAGLSAYFGTENAYVALAIAAASALGIYGRVTADSKVTM